MAKDFVSLVAWHGMTNAPRHSERMSAGSGMEVRTLALHWRFQNFTSRRRSRSAEVLVASSRVSYGRPGD